MVQIGSETSTDYCDIEDGWQIKVSKHYHNRDFRAYGGVFSKIVPNESLANKNVFRVLMVDEETEKPILSLSEAAAKIDPSHLAAFLAAKTEKKVSLCLIPVSVYDTSVHWIKNLLNDSTLNFVDWALDGILTDWESEQQGLESNAVPTFVGLALVLRSSKPDVFTTVLRELRWTPMYQGQDKLPVLVLILAQFLNSVWEEDRLIPPSSFETLLRLTFPASSARVKSTKRFEAVYPLLKEVAFAPESATGGKAVEQIFTFSLKLAGEGVVVTGNPGLAKEAAAIAIRSVTEHVDCFNHWDILYKEHLEASVALLRKLADEWKDHAPKVLSSPGDTLTVNRAMSSFRLKNEKGITEGGANCSLYKEADESCKLILGRLSRESGCLKIAPITAVVLGAAFAAAGGVAGAALALCLPLA
ncbi:PREDICTED: uncharacterized protein LOC104788717 [Camelina sativa]|uniref:Uncharacterized protein LOC104788717 n=1 Tax=Camelina sativa TaxID=90675 RepID=A0ABM1RNV9_CAMSA|nr:PREDICTED: uncharacterized protein LOC104788717 [Camelina sativa]